jgi:hypothetical protein
VLSAAGGREMRAWRPADWGRLEGAGAVKLRETGEDFFAREGAALNLRVLSYPQQFLVFAPL